jgi:arylsulfatase A-like enzyme
VILDTCRQDALGVYGGPDRITPQLDRFTNDAAVFTRAFGSSPWTLPSVATILTGRHPSEHGAHGFLQDVSAIRHDAELAGELLSGAGYRSRAVANAPFVDPRFGFARGFEEYDYFRSSKLRVRRAAKSVQNALAHVNQLSQGPFFLMLHLFDPHLAYDPSPQTAGMFTGGYDGGQTRPFADLQLLRSGTWAPATEDLNFVRGLYLEEVAAADAGLGRLFKGLERRGLYERSLIIVTADHGEEFGDHGRFEHGHSMYRELVQVPLLVKLPARDRQRTGEIDVQVRLIDILPTLLDRVGLPIPPDLPGQSLLPLLAKESSPGEDRPAFSERPHLEPDRSALRDGSWAYIYTPKGDKRELYDMRSDPLEQQDVSALHPEIVERLHGELTTITRGLRREGKSSEAPLELGEDLEEHLRGLGYLDGDG